MKRAIFVAKYIQPGNKNINIKFSSDKNIDFYVTKLQYKNNKLTAENIPINNNECNITNNDENTIIAFTPLYCDDYKNTQETCSWSYTISEMQNNNDISLENSTNFGQTSMVPIDLNLLSSYRTFKKPVLQKTSKNFTATLQFTSDFDANSLKNSITFINKNTGEVLPLSIYISNSFKNKLILYSDSVPTGDYYVLLQNSLKSSKGKNLKNIKCEISVQ